MTPVFLVGVNLKAQLKPNRANQWNVNIAGTDAYFKPEQRQALLERIHGRSANRHRCDGSPKQEIFARDCRLVSRCAVAGAGGLTMFSPVT